MSLRKNSYTVPWNLFPPLRVTTLVMDPMLPPYSAEAVLLRMRNSAIASMGMRQAKPPSMRSTFWAPSSRKLFASGRCPLTTYDCPARNEPPSVSNPALMGATPVCRSPSCEKLRPLRGKSSTSFSVTVLPRVLVVVSNPLSTL